MSADMLDRILGELRSIHTRLDIALTQAKPGLTVRAFAKKIGRHESTVHAWKRNGLIRTEKGRIPFSELSKFLSK